ncbi:uncharacterized protein LOC131956682 isoform X2 [Physella acuta]|uniref:uncharacterized protein LOC131956682 isoform X2 n=1 Tax=Physella acuta TaxID=109671 RepID=UPI0027DE68C0|nr:uncharacterized protein LOC131956682 isoform X2 [Physella acuta]
MLLIVLIVGLTQFSDAAMPVNLGPSGRQAFLEYHNKARRELKVPDLKWSPALARDAGLHAMRCVFQHSTMSHGENIYASYPINHNNTALALASLTGWLNEEPTTLDPAWPCLADLSCGHYTQVVWRATKRVGCAVTHCNGWMENLVVCKYDPPGNYIGQQPY